MITHRVRAVAALAATLLTTSLAPSAQAAHPTFETWRPGDTQLVSVTADGVQADSNLSNSSGSACYCYLPGIGRPAISGNGRYVAFASTARNLVPGDTNNYRDIFVKDRTTGEVERVSVSSAGAQANFVSSWPAISADGRFVAFASAASNLVPNDTNGGNPMFSTFTDVFVHDRETGETELVSLTSDEKQTAGSSGAPHAWAEGPAISADGRFVAFLSNATNLAPGAGGTNSAGVTHIYVRDRKSGTTTLATASSEGVPANGFGLSVPSISADGRKVAFTSVANNLAAGDNDDKDVFVKDMETGIVEMASVSTRGQQQNFSNAIYSPPAISGDGRSVAWSSQATNLVPNDANGKNFIVYGWGGGEDIFVRDLVLKTTERISLAPDGGERVADFLEPSMSHDGRFVATYGGNGVYPDDPEKNAAGYYLKRVYVHDRVLGTTEIVSVDDSGDRGNDHSSYPAIAADGRTVAFSSYATDLVSGDVNGVDDFFVRDLGPEVGAGALVAEREGPSVQVSGWAGFLGATVAGAADPATDGGTMGVSAADVGAELTGAQIAYRPERQDLLLRWTVPSLPSIETQGGFGAFTPGVAGHPAGLYVTRFRLGGTTYHVRVTRAGAGVDAPDAEGGVTPYAALFSCGTVCVEIARLRGGIGTAGNEIRVAVPLSELGNPAEGAQLTEVEASAAAGTGADGEVVVFDRIQLPSGSLPVRSIHLGKAPPSVPAQDVAFDVVASRTGARFGSSIPHEGGPVRVWAKVCLGASCSLSSVTL